jgi:hypothetical protein
MNSPAPSLNEHKPIILYPLKGIYIWAFFWVGLLFSFALGIIALCVTETQNLFELKQLSLLLIPGIPVLSLVVSGILTIRSYWPGANALCIDQTGFTYKRGWKSKRVQWSNIARMVTVSKERSRPAGIEVTLHDRPYGPSLLIVDEFTIRRSQLLELMSQHAGQNVATSAPIPAPDDIKFNKKISRVYLWVVPILLTTGLLIATFIRLRIGQSPTKTMVLATLFIGPIILGILLQLGMNKAYVRSKK